MSTTTQRLVAYHLSRLKDKSIDVRMKAIKEMELLESDEAQAGLASYFIDLLDNADKDVYQRAVSEFSALKPDSPVLKALTQHYIAQLSDSSTVKRLTAIKILETLGASEAMTPLQRVFENDADQEVRRAAQEAGKTIFRLTQQ